MRVGEERVPRKVELALGAPHLHASRAVRSEHVQLALDRATAHQGLPVGLAGLRPLGWHQQELGPRGPGLLADRAEAQGVAGHAREPASAAVDGGGWQLAGVEALVLGGQGEEVQLVVLEQRPPSLEHAQAVGRQARGAERTPGGAGQHESQLARERAQARDRGRAGLEQRWRGLAEGAGPHLGQQHERVALLGRAHEPGLDHGEVLLDLPELGIELQSGDAHVASMDS